MSDKPIPTPPVLTKEQLDAVSGGECSVSDWITATNNLVQAYEALVDFTSHVFERVSQ
jgi:hypothetical protein